MHYIWTRGQASMEIHIQNHDAVGEGLMESLCGIKKGLNATINAPYTLGRKVCKKCEQRMEVIK